MKMERLPFSLAVLGLSALMSCLVLSGCGGTTGGGTTIRGQVVLDGVPAGPDKVSHYVIANGTPYFGDVVSADGRFSHGSTGLDPEFCTPGCVVTLVFTSTDAAAFETTYVHEYVVQAGENDLGQIEIGLHGFSLIGPADGATVGSDSWPLQFQWTAYTRTGITPQYSLYLLCDIFTSFKITTAATSITLEGDETITNIFDTYDLTDVGQWWTYVEYQENGHAIQHSMGGRDITLVPPAG